MPAEEFAFVPVEGRYLVMRRALGGGPAWTPMYFVADAVEAAGFVKLCQRSDKAGLEARRVKPRRES